MILVLCTGLLAQENEQAKPLRDFQLSIFPMVGTDGAEAVHHTYRGSVNIFAGITGGIDGFEAGGFLNITHGDVRGAQLSGFGNIVRGDINGFQAAGFANVNGGDAQAFRGAGFLNITSGSFEGFQGAGFVNIVGGTCQGFAGAGFANITGGSFQGFAGAGFANIRGGDFQGFTGAGFANITGGSSQGFMGAGFANITGNDSQGFHGAGFANITGGHVSGPQLAGFMNKANNLQGIQVSGFLNIAQKLDGLQLGFINIADTVSSGIPIGFLSFVRKGGLMQFELAGSDVMFLSASFRIGVRAFYNIFSYGMRPFSDERFNGFGYGIGTNIPFSKMTGLQLEAHTTQMNEHHRWERNELDLLNEFRIMIGMNTGGIIELFAGGVFYNQFSYECVDCAFARRQVAPERTISEERINNYLSTWWFGARGGIRFHIR